MQMKGIIDTQLHMLINHINIAIWLGNYTKVQMKGFTHTYLYIIDYNLW